MHALNASRRKFLKQVGMISAGVAIPAHAAAIWESAGAVDGAISQRPNPPENLRAVADSLRDAAASKGLLFGSGVIQKYLASNAALAGIVTKQCGIIVPEWELKWDFLRPTQDKLQLWACRLAAEFCPATPDEIPRAYFGLVQRAAEMVCGYREPIERATDTARSHQQSCRPICRENAFMGRCERSFTSR